MPRAAYPAHPAPFGLSLSAAPPVKPAAQAPYPPQPTAHHDPTHGIPVNFTGCQRITKYFKNLQGNPKGTVMVKYYIRLAIMAGVLYLLISNHVVDIIGLKAIGLSVVIINILVTMIIALAKKNFIEEVV